MSNEQHWSEPGAYPVAEGVHRIPLPLPMDGLKAVNVYVVETELGLTLIDGGWSIEVARELLETSLRTIGYHPRDITSFLVTHSHRDHYTQAIAIRTEFGNAQVSLGIGDKPVLDLFQDGDLEEDPNAAQLRMAGAFDLAHAWRDWAMSQAPNWDHWQLPDIWLDGDQELKVGSRTLDAVSTPGHTQGHFVFADQEAGILFAGDHVLPTITPSIGFEPVYAALPLGDFLRSLLKVRALPDLQLLPAHGATDRRSHERVDELLAHHDHRLDLCQEAVSPEGSTAYDVARRITWTRHERTFAELDQFNAGMACMETKAHLDLLVEHGRLTRSESDGAFVYHPVSQT